MKTTLKIILMLCIINAYGQKVKVKKEILTIEKKEVAKFIEQDRNQFQVQQLNGTPVFNLAFERETIPTLAGEETFEYLKFTKPNNDEIFYCDYDLTNLKTSFSGEKTIIRHLIINNQFLSEDGINQASIDTFFSSPKLRSKTIEDKKAEYQAAYKYVEDFNLKFNGNKIIQVGEEEVIVGSYKFKEIPNMNMTSIKVFDAKGFLTGTHSGSSITLFDGNKIKFKAYSRDNTENAHNVVKRLIIAGYTLGDMQAKKASIRRNNNKNAISAEKTTSNNIYDKKATVYDAEGNTINGTVKIEFKELEANKSGMSSLNNYGGVATLTTLKDNGKEKYTDYKAKNGFRICLEDSKKCLKGLMTKGMTAAKFNEEIDVTGKLKLYKSLSFDYYVIKKDNEDKGLIVLESSLLKEDNSEKMFEKIIDYLSDCSSLKSKIDTSALDLKNEVDLKTIIATYNACN